jgi:DNA helicase MCM8
MEQQSISVAKSGVVTSLKSRTSVLAAANPAGGHYNRRKTVCENLKVAAALLSRFDLVFILLDKPDESHDRMISEHIMRTHALAGQSNSNTNNNCSKNNGTSQQSRRDDEGVGSSSTLSQRLRRAVTEYAEESTSGDPYMQNKGGVYTLLPTEVMRKYIEYARRYCNPKLTKAAAKVLQRLYLTMRAQSSLGNSIPVTTRHLESLIRLSQARARLELREEVTEVYMYMYIYIYLLCMSISIYTYKYKLMYYVYICIYIYMYLAYVYMYKYIYIYIYTYV